MYFCRACFTVADWVTFAPGPITDRMSLPT